MRSGQTSNPWSPVHAARRSCKEKKLDSDEQRADPALDTMLLDQGLNSHRSAPELDADLVLDDASCART
ncbi:hypothetical protein PF010_g10878 [Phytophthora fragariae]|uniref:Uncharacterized protein n=1 Tax=Phytophthora fragariae TaxID=53985 RepID=A0A6A3YGU1_9STRA|nr:hypothetical protein PF010_g10878 [Phytophthora fragariae]KAE9218682.1 hypothetical protein PF002_g16428 [Phytophthora fragariae]KAE9341575.1 hypothetical protein PF008_g10563 [Phytophthora fragariae]